jgi:hypothetical protein
LGAALTRILRASTAWRYHPKGGKPCTGTESPERVNVRAPYHPRIVELELIPEQPRAVESAVAVALAEAAPAPDPWWEAGNREALET